MEDNTVSTMKADIALLQAVVKEQAKRIEALEEKFYWLELNAEVEGWEEGERG